jgi:hypothetical protein
LPHRSRIRSEGVEASLRFASALIDDKILDATCSASIFIFLNTTRDPCAQEALANRYAASLTIVARMHIATCGRGKVKQAARKPLVAPLMGHE